MKYFGIDDRFIELVKLFFTNFSTYTQNAGFISDAFIKSCSINQGCPISPYLFLLCSEIMAHKLQSNSKISGVTVGDVKMLLSQFADDTVIYLNFDLSELNAVIEVLDYIYRKTYWANNLIRQNNGL